MSPPTDTLPTYTDETLIAGIRAGTDILDAIRRGEPSPLTAAELLASMRQYLDCLDARAAKGRVHLTSLES
jgi:hypothetical protein